MAKQRGRKKKSTKETVLDNVSQDDILAQAYDSPDNVLQQHNEFISTGDISINAVLGGGFSVGALTEIFAPEGTGKTALLVDTALNLQQAGMGSVVFDTEGGWVEPYLESRGGVVNDPKHPAPIMIYRFRTTETIDEWLMKVLPLPKMKFYVIDSLQGMVPQKILDSGVGQVEPGLQARYNGVVLMKINKFAQIYQKAIVMVSQMRTSISFVKGGTVEAAGGKAVKFFSSVRMGMKVVKKEYIEDNSDPIFQGKRAVGQYVDFHAYKNRITAPFKTSSAFLRYGEGYDNTQILLDIGKKLGLIVQAGSYFKFKFSAEEAQVQGYDAARKYIKENFEEVRKALNAAGCEV